MNIDYYLKQYDEFIENGRLAYEALMSAKTIIFFSTEPTPQQTWEHFWKRFFESRDKHK